MMITVATLAARDNKVRRNTPSFNCHAEKLTCRNLCIKALRVGSLRTWQVAHWMPDAPRVSRYISARSNIPATRQVYISSTSGPAAGESAAPLQHVPFREFVDCRS